jgi:uncharacterized protein
LQQKVFPHQATGEPRVWILASPHSGDNTQLLALAEELRWPFEVKRLVYGKRESLLRFLNLATLAGLDKQKSSPLEAPWPDIILCAGRGAEAVSYWIRSHGNSQLKIVFVGTPWNTPERFDLVITTPQYRLSEAPNILHNMLPMHGVTAQKIAAEAERWSARLAHLPSPRFTVLVGGSSGPYIFTAGAARRLGQQVSEMAKARGGSLLVTTSARTPRKVAEALQASISVPSYIHRWSRDAAENPFHAFLGLGDEIVVTADSVSMLAEAIASGKPVSLFDIEEGGFAMRAEDGFTKDNSKLPPIRWRGRTLDATAFRLLINHAPVRWSRDLRIVHRQLVDSGLAHWLGEVPKPTAKLPQPALTSAAARIRGLFGL